MIRYLCALSPQTVTYISQPCRHSGSHTRYLQHTDTHTHTHTHTHIHIHTHTYMHTHTHVHTQVLHSNFFNKYVLSRYLALRFIGIMEEYVCMRLLLSPCCCDIYSNINNLSSEWKLECVGGQCHKLFL